MKKRLFALLVVFLSAFSVIPAFAGETGSAVGTFGVGFTYFGGDVDQGYTALCFDLDLVSIKGLTFSFGNKVDFDMDKGIYNLTYIGFGYRYLEENWHIGLSIIAVPFGSADCIVGVKPSAGVWFTESVGMTLIMMIGSGVMDDFSAFSLMPGFSVRL